MPDNIAQSEGGESAPDGGSGMPSLILRTAAVTAVIFIAVLALLASFVSAVAPRAFMELYRSLGAYGMAAVYAGEAIDRTQHDENCTDGGCAYIELVSDAVDIAAAAYGDSQTARHAEYLYTFSSAYLSASCHEAHSSAEDAYVSKKYADSPYMLCGMLGYDGYVRESRVTAMRALSDRAYDGALGSGYDDCKTMGDALGVLAGNAAKAFESHDMEAARELTAYASDSDDVSAIEGETDALSASFDALTAAAGELTGNAKAYAAYTLYRLADAFESASGGAEFESVWTEARADAAYDAFADAVMNA